jgi:phage-related tail protein
VVPGRYQARLTAAGETQSQPFEVRKDPRLATTDADLAKQQELLLKIRDKLTASHDAISRIRGVGDQVKTASERAKGSESEKAVLEAADALSKKLTAVEEALYQTKNRASQDPLNYPIRLNNKLAALGGTVASADAAPTAQSYAVYDELAARIDAELATLDRVLADDVPAFNRLVREKEIPAVRIAKP